MYSCSIISIKGMTCPNVRHVYTSAELSRLYKSLALCGVALLALPMLHYSRYAIKYVQTLCCSSCMAIQLLTLNGRHAGRAAGAFCNTHYTHLLDGMQKHYFIYLCFLYPSIH